VYATDTSALHKDLSWIHGEGNARAGRRQEQRKKEEGMNTADLRGDIKLLLVTVNNRLKFEIEIVHDLSCTCIFVKKFFTIFTRLLLSRPSLLELFHAWSTENPWRIITAGCLQAGCISRCPPTV